MKCQPLALHLFVPDWATYVSQKATDTTNKKKEKEVPESGICFQTYHDSTTRLRNKIEKQVPAYGTCFRTSN